MLPLRPPMALHKPDRLELAKGVVMSEQQSSYGNPSPLTPIHDAIAALEAAETAVANLSEHIGSRPYMEEQLRWILDHLRHVLAAEETVALEKR